MKKSSIISFIVITLIVILVGVVINKNRLSNIFRNNSQPITVATPANLTNLQQADALYVQGKYEDAFLYYQKANQAKENQAEAYAGLGNISMKWRRYDDAAGFYTQSLSVENNPTILSSRCNAYRLLAEYQAAEQDCNSAIQLDPNNAEGYAALAMLQLEQNNTSDARETIDKALESIQNSADLHYVSAQIFTKQGELVNAINELSSCIRINPDQLRCYWERGFDYYMNGEIGKAKADMNTIIDKANPEVDSELLYQAGNLLDMLDGNP
jgi:tetratricopeptide (TPR) repeat protein